MLQPEQSPPSILIIERDRGVRTMLARLVSSWGFEALSAESEGAGLRLLNGTRAVALVLSDFQPTAGERTLRDHLTRQSASPAPPFLCTLPSTHRPEGVPFIRRPFDAGELRKRVLELIGDG